MSYFKKFLKVFAFLVPMFFLLPIGASAHANAVSASQICLENGDAQVTWTITNDFNLSESAHYSHTNPALVGDPFVSILAGNGQTGSVVEVYSGLSTTTLNLYVKGVWSDTFSTQNSGSITLSGDCPQPVVEEPPVDEPTDEGTTTPPVTPPTPPSGGSSGGSGGGHGGGGHRQCVMTTTGLYCPQGVTPSPGHDAPDTGVDMDLWHNIQDGLQHLLQLWHSYSGSGGKG